MHQISIKTQSGILFPNKLKYPNEKKVNVLKRRLPKLNQNRAFFWIKFLDLLVANSLNCNKLRGKANNEERIILLLGKSEML